MKKIYIIVPLIFLLILALLLRGNILGFRDFVAQRLPIPQSLIVSQPQEKNDFPEGTEFTVGGGLTGH